MTSSIKIYTDYLNEVTITCNLLILFFNFHTNVHFVLLYSGSKTQSIWKIKFMVFISDLEKSIEFLFFLHVPTYVRFVKIIMNEIPRWERKFFTNNSVNTFIFIYELEIRKKIVSNVTFNTEKNWSLILVDSYW